MINDKESHCYQQSLKLCEENEFNSFNARRENKRWKTKTIIFIIFYFMIVDNKLILFNLIRPCEFVGM
jgi:hypothetical protein